MLNTTNQTTAPVPATNGGLGGNGVTYASLPGVNSYTPYLGFYWGGGGAGAGVSKVGGKGGLGGGGQGGWAGGSAGGISDTVSTVINLAKASTLGAQVSRGWTGGVNSGGGGGGNQDNGGGGPGGSGIVIIAFKL
jgi:hypothetical protein